MTSKIAILGVGAMGARMARVLIKAGMKVTVYNRNPEKAKALVADGAVYAATPREAARGVDTTISMVTDVDASKQVWLDPSDGALLGVERRSIVIEASTVTPAWIRELDSAVRMAGADFLEAPVVGTLPHAESGQLVSLVGGDSPVLERAMPLLSVLSRKVLHVGTVGHGTALKLGVNAFFGIQVSALAEILGLVTESGIEIAKLASFLSELPVMSPVATAAMKQIVDGNFSPFFPVRLVVKDFNYVIAAAEQQGRTLPVVMAALDAFRECSRRGMNNENISAVAKIYSLSEPSTMNA